MTHIAFSDFMAFFVYKTEGAISFGQKQNCFSENGQARKGGNMPSQAHLEQKQAVVEEISEKLVKASSVVVIDYIGISVDQANSMRNKLRDAGVDYKVYKNTLVKRAIAGTGNEKLAEVLEGPSAFAFGYEDATAPARVLDSVIKEFKKMEFKAGIVEGVFYDADGIKQVASIPSKEVLIARFLGSVQSPIGKLVRTFAAIADAESGDGAETAVAVTSAEDVPVVEEAVAAADVAPAAAEVEAAPAVEVETVPAEEEDVAPTEAPEAETPTENAQDAAPAVEEVVTTPTEETDADAPTEAEATEE
jgi:large subunit ribosomal protein L10